MDPFGVVVVTGAHGLLGRAAHEALRARGADVVPLVRGPDGAPLEWAPDRMPRTLAEALDGARAVVHLAAGRPTRFDAAGVDALAAANLALDARVFAAAAGARVPVVYASGCSVYGSRSLEPLTEDAPCAPLGPYPAAKLEAERLGRSRAADVGTRFVALRIAAPYGPHQTAATVLQRFVTAALAGAPLRYFGDGSREQDFIHVDDVARAVVEAVARPVDGVFHVASGVPTTMRALADAVARAVHAEEPSLRVVVEPAGEPDPQAGLTARYDLRRAREALGVEPRVSLDAGLAALVAARRAPP